MSCVWISHNAIMTLVYGTHQCTQQWVKMSTGMYIDALLYFYIQLNDWITYSTYSLFVVCAPYWWYETRNIVDLPLIGIIVLHHCIIEYWNCVNNSCTVQWCWSFLHWRLLLARLSIPSTFVPSASQLMMFLGIIIQLIVGLLSFIVVHATFHGQSAESASASDHTTQRVIK